MRRFLLLISIGLCSAFYSNASVDLESFLADFTPVYDCPDLSQLDVIDAFLEQKDLSIHETLDLQSRKSHALICSGDYVQAEQIVETILNNRSADRGSRYYVATLYQYAFIFDVRGDAQRCHYYSLAKDSAFDKYVDIRTSASLNHTIYCVRENLSVQLAQIYEILEEITRSMDKAAMAHAHNTIGLFYAGRTYFYMAIEQYEKASKLARQIYTPENQLSILMSLITNYMNVNDMDKASEVLREFSEINSKIDSARYTFLEYYSSAGIFIRTQNFDALRNLMQEWEAVKSRYQDPFAQGLFRWYAAELCLQDGNIQCLFDYQEFEKNAPARFAKRIVASRDYLMFKVKMYITTEQPNKALSAFEAFNRKVRTAQYAMQDNNAAYGVAIFQQQINDLEAQLEAQARFKNQIIISTFVLIVLITLVLFWFYRNKLKRSRLYDSATGLLNSSAAISRISRLPPATQNKTNALAIFDIANFTEVNLSLGAAKGDMVLKRIASTLKTITRDSDILGVFGPNQFILCLSDIEEQAANSFFERVNKALANTFGEHSNTGGYVSVDSSMSIYYSNESFQDIEEILNHLLSSINIKSKS